MADDLSKRILLEVESNLKQAIQQSEELNTTLDEQLTKQRLLELQGKRNTTEYTRIASQVRLTKQAIRDNNREIDNANRSFSAQTNSIQQNRAVLSVLTGEYIRASQEQGKTSEKTLKLKADIDSLTKTLKEQEKVFTTSRNVGNYQSDISNALNSIIGSVPGLQQFSGAAQTATRVIGFLPSAMGKAGNSIMNFVSGNPGRSVIEGFRNFKQSAAAATEEIEGTAKVAEGEATAGMESLGAASGEAAGAEGLGAITAASAGTAGGLLALLAVLYTVTEGVKSLGSVSYKSGQILAGVKAGAISAFNSIMQGKSAEDIVKGIKSAYNEGVELKKGLQDLEAQEMKAGESDKFLTNQINRDMLALRNRAMTLDQAKQLDAKLNTEEKQRVTNKLDNANQEYDIALKSAINGKNLDEKTAAQHIKAMGNMDAAELMHLERINQINAGATEQIDQARQKILDAQGEKDQLQQKQLNRMTIIQERWGKRNAKAANDTINEMAEANKGWQQVLQERVESTGRLMAVNQDEFSRQLQQIDNKYAELIYKEQQFIAAQARLSKLSKDPAAKSKFEKNAAGGKKNVGILEAEQDKMVELVTQEHNERMADLIQKSTDELRKIQIAGMEDVREKQKQELEQQYVNQVTALDQQTEELQREQKANTDLMQSASDDRKKILQDENAQIQQLIDLNGKKRDDLANGYNQQLNDIANKNSFSDLMDSDKAAEILAALNYEKHPNKKNEDAEFASQNKTLDDKHNQDALDLQNHKITLDQFNLLDAEYRKNKFDLDRKAAADQLLFTKQNVEEIYKNSFTILQNGLNRESQAREVSLNNQKTFELNNQSLTATQRAIIEDKYRKEEGKAKVAEFRANQKLSIAQAIIDGALAAIKTDAETGAIVGFAMTPLLIAKTMATVTTIAAQQPPAYATGGIHYASDGRGTLLSGPGTGKSDSMLARVSNGESIINANSTQRFASLLSAINVAGGGKPFSVSSMPSKPWVTPGFATGGIASFSYSPIKENGLHIMNVDSGINLHVDSIDGIVDGIMRGFSKMPNPVVNIRDLGYAQQQRAIVVDRSTI